MLFKLSYTVAYLDIHSSELMKFELGAPDDIRLFVRAPTDDERSKGQKSFNAFLDILGEFEPTKKSLLVFNAWLDEMRPTGGEKVR